MLSSNGTVDFPSWRRSSTLMVTGWAAVAPRAAWLRAVMTWPAVGLGHDVGERTHLNELGIVAQQPGDRSRGGFEEPGGGHQHDDGARRCAPGTGTAPRGRWPVRNAGAWSGRAGRAARGSCPERLQRGADDLDQAPSRDGLDADLNGVADVLVLNGGERAEHELLVVGVHQAQAPRCRRRRPATVRTVAAPTSCPRRRCRPRRR